MTINNLQLTVNTLKLIVKGQLSKVTQSGFTLPEVIVVKAIMLTLLGLSSVSLAGVSRTTSIGSTVDAFIADVKEQQVKAMVGDTEGSGSAASYGVHFEGTSY